MKSRTFLPALLFVAASCALAGGPVQVFVSGTGSDSNSGTRTAPFKTFAAALQQSDTHSLISVLDTAGYGSVTISKSAIIDGEGFDASINVSGTTGILVSAAPTDVVILRHLNLQGIFNSPIGIRVVHAAAVYIQDCKISGFDKGISFESQVPGAQLFVDRTVIQEGNIDGIVVTGGTATIRNSVASGIFVSPTSTPAGNGFHAGPGARITLEGCTASGNAKGIYSEGTIYLADSTVTNNIVQGLVHSPSGQIISARNNRVMGNTLDGKVTKTIPLR